MNNEQQFAHREGAICTSTLASDESGNGADERIRAALAELNQVRIGPVSRTEGNQTLGLLGQAQSVVAWLMCDVTSAVADSEPDTDPAEVLRQGARLPGRESKKMAKISEQLSEMPKVRERFSTGELTPTHANAPANAARKVGPEAVEADETLLEAADQMSPDSFDRHARKWSDRKLIGQGLDPLARQRKARGGQAMGGEGNRARRGDGRGPPPPVSNTSAKRSTATTCISYAETAPTARDPDDVCTPTQRLADVMYELLTNRDAVTGQFVTGTVGIKAKASTQVILTAPMGVVDGTNPNGQVEMIGVGPVPRSILEALTPDTDLAAMIFDRAGRPLRLGRKQRIGNAAQRLAVAIRDGGCFECGAPMHRCELHHIEEWHRDQGRTDIHSLVAVCRRHHKRLETDNLIVRRTPNGYQIQPRAGPGPPG